MGNKNSIPGRQSGPQAQWAPGYTLTGLGSVSSTNTYLSEIFNAANLDNLAVQVQFTGTMTGTLTIQCSADNSVYDDLTGFSPALSQPAGSNLHYTVMLYQVPFPYLRIQYVNSSGSGTLKVIVAGKDLN